MFQIDDKFLQQLGLGQLPDDQKQAFKEHIYSELELRVGIRLSEGLSDEQLREFESFVDRSEENDAKVRTWVAMNTPAYANDPAYTQLRAKAPEGMSETILLAEYASLKWLGMNRPNYRDVVAQVIEELKQEIMNNRDTILGDTAQAA